MASDEWSRYSPLGDCWLPSLPHAYPILSSEVQISRNITVDSLFDPVTEVWNIEFIRPFISVQEINAILATSSGDSRMRDKLVWSPAPKDVYFVKSGYHWKCSQVFPRLPHASSSAAIIPAVLWKWEWKLHTPSKLRCFMWKTLHGALPTMVALFHRSSSASPTCLLCHNHEESVEHIFLLCPWVAAILFERALTYRVDRNAITSWGSWLLALFQAHAHSKEDLQRVMS